MAQLMPLALTVSCFSKIQIGFTFLGTGSPGSPDKGPLNGCMYDMIQLTCKIFTINYFWISLNSINAVISFPSLLVPFPCSHPTSSLSSFPFSYSPFPLPSNLFPIFFHGRYGLSMACSQYCSSSVTRSCSSCPNMGTTVAVLKGRGLTYHKICQLLMKLVTDIN